MLYIVSTPIGNLDDITIRALKVLGEADIVLCEDTRHTGQLLHELKSRHPAYFNENKPQLVQYHEHNEDNKVAEILGLLKNNKNIALVSDAGTPLISDPGYPLVAACQKKEIKVQVIPGASSILTALVSSGLPPYPFTFLGYLPEKSGKRKKLFEEIKKSSLESTFISFLSPYKFEGVFEDMQSVFGNIPIVVARELTKVHEEIKSGTAQKINDEYKKNPPKGELTLLFRHSTSH